MAEKKKKAWAQRDVEDWGSYMAAKKAKLEEQYQEAAISEFNNPTNIFNGIAIFVNGYTNPSADELKRLMMEHGGIFHHYLRSHSTTHMIASNLPYSKIVAYRKAQNPLPLCKPEWITNSIKAGVLLDYRNYLLYSQCTKNQPNMLTLLKNQDTENQSSSSRENQPSSSSSHSNNTLIPQDINTCSTTTTSTKTQNSTKNPEFLSDFYNNSRLHHIATMGATFKDYVNELRKNSNRKFSGLEALQASNLSSNLEKNKLIKQINGLNSDDECDFPLVTSYSCNHSNAVNNDKIIMHIDMDCFFVSVGLRNKPHLKGFPIAVAHAKGNRKELLKNESEYGSMSEVASCSYEARRAGVKNGMFLGQALKLCPELKTIPYDFDAYKEVSYILYDTIASYTLDIEAVSCDEMYVDCSSILNKCQIQPLQFADFVRKEIKEKTGCPVSTGFGKNKLQARLATKKAKPDGQCFLDEEGFKEFVSTLKVRDLPAVGYSLSSRLSQMNVNICLDLQKLSLPDLQKEFGLKIGQQLYDLCRGIDTSKLNYEHIRKSVSAEVNYGIRFENSTEATQFLNELSAEVSDRLKKASMKGHCITLKVMVRSNNAPVEAKKFMGHGVCDSYSKSKNLIAPTDDPITIFREVQHLWNQVIQHPEDARGIGIQITKLESTHKKKGETNILNFFQKNTNYQSCTSISSSSSRKDGPSESNDEIHTNKSNIYNTSTKVGSNCIVSSVDVNQKAAVKKPSSIQKTQINYFKETKSMPKSSKVKLPELQEIDMRVLIELPEEIRNEVLNEYKQASCDKVLINLNHEQKSLTHSPIKSLVEPDLSFSQIDPDFLAALPEEIKSDVKSYCEEKKKQKNNLEPQAGPSKNISNRNVLRPEIKSNKEQKIMKIVKSRTFRIPEKSLDKDASSGVHYNAQQKIRTVQTLEHLEASSTNSYEASNILSQIVECLLELPLSQVRLQIQTWICNNTDNINDVDFLSLTTYLGTLPRKKRLQDLHTLIKCLHRCAINTGNCVWHETYKKMMEHVQTRMQMEYNFKLMVPSQIECFKCNTIRN